jgi:hypothetical protein
MVFVSCCGYCGDPIDYCQGHGEDERKAFGFEADSDEYEKRRDSYELLFLYPPRVRGIR